MAKSLLGKVVGKVVGGIKDVATLKTFRENFFKNDGSISQWFAHGATEAANMVLHGHAAPVYAGNVSPPDLMSNEMQTGIAEPMQVFAEQPDQKVNILQSKMQEIERQPEVEEPEIKFEH